MRQLQTLLLFFNAQVIDDSSGMPHARETVAISIVLAAAAVVGFAMWLSRYIKNRKKRGS